MKFDDDDFFDADEFLPDPLENCIIKVESYFYAKYYPKCSEWPWLVEIDRRPVSHVASWKSAEYENKSVDEEIYDGGNEEEIIFFNKLDKQKKRIESLQNWLKKNNDNPIFEVNKFRGFFIYIPPEVNNEEMDS